MGNLSDEKRLKVLNALVNGNSIRAAERTTGVHRDTIMRFALRIGEGCQRLHDRLVRDLSSALVDLDEQHSWCRKKQKLVDPEKDDESIIGEQWTWAALDRTSKLTIAWHVGKRDAASADKIVADTRSRLATMPQITTDGLKLYEEPIFLWFGYAVLYAKMIKHFKNGGGRPGTVAEKFAVPKGVDLIEKRVVFGCPNLHETTTWAIERSNLTNRQWNARLHRRTLCFSKRLPNHKAAIALMYVYRNLCWISRDMRETAAMAAGVTDHVWSIAELMAAALSEPAGEKPKVKDLIIPKPEGTSRELPAGRGWLHVVGSKARPAPPQPGPGPATPPAAAVAVAAAAPVEPPSPQLDLFASTPCPAALAKPLPPPGTQLDLFGPMT